MLVFLVSLLTPKNNNQLLNCVIFTLCPQLFKRRNVSVPANEESMLECPIQDPDISSTVPVAGVSILSLNGFVSKASI